MALIKLGALVTQISGKVGGQTFGTGPSGSYLKNSGTPRKAITLLQQSKMQRMSTSAQAWRSLTDEQREVYRSASSSYPYLNRVGETKYLSGFAIFTKLRNNLLNIGVTPTPEPLPLFSFPPLIGASLSEAAGVFTISTTSGNDVAATYRLFCSRPASQGVTNGYQNKYFIQNVTYTELGAGLDVTESLEAKFGALPDGSRMYWRLDGINTSNGQTLKNMASGSVSW